MARHKPKHRRKPEAKKSPKLRHIPTAHVDSARHMWRYKRHIKRHIFRKQKDTFNFAQRSIESLITEILDDEKMPKDKKADALIKYYKYS